MIHLWVDPHYGDDALAVNGTSSSNPSCTPPTGCVPTECKPHDVLDPNQNNAVLLHAPWPFRTVTAAIKYLPVPLAIGGDPLPDTSTATGLVWDFAVIHCLPGLYAKTPTDAKPGSFTKSQPGEWFYQPNYLIPNGETFPIRLPNRVSVQGTSALNTIFFLDQQEGPIFEFGTVKSTEPIPRGIGTFIDKVSMFGAKDDSTNQAAAGQLAAIYCGRDATCSPTITNCFIFGNIVGILLDAPAQEEPVTTWHTPVIVNNSLVWNRAGIWNGMFVLGQVPASVGRGRPVLFNNILDMGSPFLIGTDVVYRTATPVNNRSSWLANGITCFEGLAREDLLIATTGGSSPITNENFNAYQASASGQLRFQTNLPITFLPPTAPPAALNAPPNPTIDITPWTNPLFGVPSRGVLFVRDALLAGTVFHVSGSFDRSPHDLRLFPAVATPGQTPAAGGRNPLVDRGWSPQATTTFPVTMQNGQVLATYPGFLNDGFDHHLWEFDCEGFANPRIHDHPLFSGVPVNGGTSGPIDVGADELGEYVVTGWRFATTTFMTLPANLFATGILAADNKYVWYLGLPGNTSPAPPAKPWVLRSNFRRAPPAQTDTWKVGRYKFGRLTVPYYTPTVVDVSPHLLPDVHPYWATTPVGPSSNPIWQVWRPSTGCGSPLYNWILYVPPNYGVINPPGTYLATTTYQWLDFSGSAPAVSTFIGGIFSSQGAGAWQYFDDWGRAASGTPSTGLTGFHDTLKSTIDPTTGVLMMKRYSLEHKKAPLSNTTSDRNLQSVLVIVKPLP